MNRNQLYHYLKEKGLYGIFRRRKNGYHVEFCENAESDYGIYRILTDWGYIRGVERIHLCTNEVVIESKYGFGKVNIFYKDMDKFEVELYDKTLYNGS